MAGLLALVFPLSFAVLFLTLGYFVIFLNRNVESNNIKVFGKVVVSLLCVVAGFIFLTGLLTSFAASHISPYGARANIARNPAQRTPSFAGTVNRPRTGAQTVQSRPMLPVKNQVVPPAKAPQTESKATASEQAKTTEPTKK